MFQLDDKFLEDIGLGSLPDDQKKAFLQHIYEELELRVGTRLSEGLSDQQLEEFEKIIDKDQAVIEDWLAIHVQDYTNDDVFKRMQQALKLDAGDPALKAEYVATKWLEINRPDYRDVVKSVLEELKVEIMSNRDAILGGGSENQPVENTSQSDHQPPAAA
jgi:hypothetical protein|tara:strand:+ start:8003 stop:8485 length:483 start_codon:yes stop_codon:yes gene_type:complete